MEDWSDQSDSEDPSVIILPRCTIVSESFWSAGRGSCGTKVPVTHAKLGERGANAYEGHRIQANEPRMVRLQGTRSRRNGRRSVVGTDLWNNSSSGSINDSNRIASLSRT